MVRQARASALIPPCGLRVLGRTISMLVDTRQRVLWIGNGLSGALAAIAVVISVCCPFPLSSDTGLHREWQGQDFDIHFYWHHSFL